MLKLRNKLNQNLCNFIGYACLWNHGIPLFLQSYIKAILKEIIVIRGGSQITFASLGGWVVQNLEKLQTL